VERAGLFIGYGFASSRRVAAKPLFDKPLSLLAALFEREESDQPAFLFGRKRSKLRAYLLVATRRADAAESCKLRVEQRQ
jgi:hypothetical protein